jgi:DNA-directed RNA polymerase beta' subunit
MACQDVKETASIIFGVYSTKEIIEMSVCKVNIAKLTGPGSVYDERMGSSIETNNLCATCGKCPKVCSGHFGYIELNEYIIHPLFYKNVVSFLKCFCIQCNRLLISEDQIKLCGLDKFKGENRFKLVLDKLEKVDICCYCNNTQPKISYSTLDNTICMEYKEKVNVYEEHKSKSSKHKSKQNSKISIELSVEEINKFFDAILDEDVILCGFDPTRMHPRNLIMSVFPVIPPCARPFVISDGNICDDDLTNQIIEIIKANNILAPDTNNLVNEKNELRKQKALQCLKFRIMTFYNNSQGKAKHPTNGRPIKGIKERITGKEGQIRNNLMGKRVEFSGRTVIGPDPKLPFGWMAMPEAISKDLTIPEIACVYNLKYLENIVNTNKANFIVTVNNNEETRLNLKYAMFTKGTELLPNDIIIRNGKKLEIIDCLKEGDKIERNGKILDKIYYSTKKKITLKLGDVVHRHLKDGDTVLLNRQPTLHKGSMLAMKIRVMPGKTFKFNLATTKTFNADFDGDEMNIHVPQSIEARTELELLSASKYNIMSAQASKPNMCIVQDSLVAAFLMTKDVNNNLTKSQFFDISLTGEMKGKSLWSKERVKIIKNVLKMKGKNSCVYNGRGLVSLILPYDFIYEQKNDAYSDEPIVKIYRGVMYEGALDKTTLGACHNSLIQVIHKEYGVDMASEFISNIQFISNGWLLVNGFSIGLEDCLITSPENVIQIQDKISRCYVEADGIEATTYNEGIREVRITAALSKAKDVGMKIAKDSMLSTNNLLSTVLSGSKGDFFNIAQLTGLLGQQNLLGKRVQPTLNNSKRTLPHYAFGKLDKEVEYESRGFVRHSFIEGLNPQEFFFHAMSGREGVCDTAMGKVLAQVMPKALLVLLF